MFEPLRAGSLVGRFRIEGVIGSGGMGVVHSARDEHLNRRVALKVMAGHLAADPVFRERFVREASVLGQLDSPHIVQVFDHGEVDGHLWIATQLVDGGDLAQLLARSGPLPAQQARDLCVQVAEALHSAHLRGIVHRDVKPANILLADSRANHLHAYLTDFGLARQIGDEVTAVRATAGTWDFLAPECGSGEPATPASDVYAVGCLLWTALTGRPPFAGTEIEVALSHARDAPPRLRPDTSLSAAEARQLNAVIAKAMHKDPQRRHASAADLAAALRATGDTRARKPRAYAGAALAALAVAGTIGAVMFLGDRHDGSPGGSGPGTAGGPVTGDYDGDGLGDIAILTRLDARTDIHRLVTSGESLQAPEPWTRIANDSTVMRGDIDGDDRLELVALRGRTNGDYRADIIPAEGAPTRNLPLVADRSATPLYAVLGDFDGDERDDLAITTDIYDSEGTSRVWVGLSTGDGFGEFTQWYASDRPLAEPVPGDFDGDGDDDIAVVDTGSIDLLTSDGSGFDGPATQALTQRPGSLAPGDFDGDGTDELVGLSSQRDSLLVWSHDGEQWNEEVTGAISGEVATSVPAGVSDFNGDGRDDVLLVTGDYLKEVMTLRASLSNGEGFDEQTTWQDYHHSVDHSFRVIGDAGS